MKTDANVVHLKTVNPEQKSNHPTARLPAVLVEVRDKVAEQLRLAQQALFDNADDTLFEMADRATSNAEQNAFFEAMRDLRLRRKQIERAFLDKVADEFATLNQYEIGRPVLENVSFESLSLVQNDALEEAVAVESMVAKVISRDGQALGHLTARLNALVSKKLDEKNNPVGPASLCAAFMDCCGSLGVEIRVKLIVLKLFDKYVLSELGQLYAEANELLVAAGVLPEIKSVPPRRPQAAPVNVAMAAGESDSAAVSGESVQEVFGMLQGLLSQARGSVIPQRPRPADALPITSNDLMRLLSHMQQRAPVQAEADGDLREQLENLLARASAKSGKTRVVGEMDEDVINLVSMLFEFILDDRTLPDSLKALIGRLQIPMLKVAVIDKSFFSRGSHPARRLLNEIAAAALGWSEQGEAQRDNLYQKIEQVVQRLLNDFTDDPQIFADLLADFTAFMGDERRRSELLEQRTRDAEEGSAKAALARQTVEQALNERLLGRTLPEVVVRLLQDAWSKTLMLTCLKHGDSSPEWQAVLSTMDELIWSVEPHDHPGDRERLLAVLPEVVKALRKGVEDSAFDPFAAEALFSQLEALHWQALQRFDKPVAEVRSEPAIVVDDGGLELPLLVEPVGVAEAAEPEPAPAMVEVVEEIVLLAPGESAQPVQEVELDDNDEAVQQVDALRVGSWLEFQQEDERKLRCKLAAFIKPTGKYIFVNRNGMKVLEKTRMGLAVEFRRQSIRLLNDALLFDRALESVIGNLRKLKGE
ncbi:DUF1631 domain-containing protein [Pseudomonas sp. TTU2014-080ASC]|uniref:DUF1631 domain-containing protein n=1 Tax=Pseudomonas sp. TTU2014-080ASC TaxID=1729724 RepID=UPI00071894E8|nr:DUF1631 domain-containing protein [Pseudomonas sp. TTU2014-080ASC]KRW62809.1 thymidine phosphorylase [Pseudomonas sp. TTU2014-080ASC]